MTAFKLASSMKKISLVVRENKRESIVLVINVDALKMDICAIAKNNIKK